MWLKYTDKIGLQIQNTQKISICKERSVYELHNNTYNTYNNTIFT